MKHQMNQEIANAIFGGIVNPARVNLGVCSDYTSVMSAKNTNDTVTWFETNAGRLEDNLTQRGYRWCYVIETIPQQEPCIYMLIAEDMTLEKAKAYTEEVTATVPEGREFHYADQPFAAIGISQYDLTEPSIFEQYADAVITVKEV